MIPLFLALCSVPYPVSKIVPATFQPVRERFLSPAEMPVFSPRLEFRQCPGITELRPRAPVGSHQCVEQGPAPAGLRGSWREKPDERNVCWDKVLSQGPPRTCVSGFPNQPPSESRGDKPRRIPVLPTQPVYRGPGHKQCLGQTPCVHAPRRTISQGLPPERKSANP